MLKDVHNHGIDWNGPIPEDNEVSEVVVPEVRNPLSEQDFHLLQTTISPVAPSDCFGVDVYIHVLQFVTRT